MKNPFVTLLQSRIGYKTESYIVGGYRHWYYHLCSCTDTAFDEDDFLDQPGDIPPKTALRDKMSAGAVAELKRETEDGEDL